MEKKTSKSLDTDFSIVISFRLFDESFACTYALSNKDVKSFKLFSGSYNSTFTDDEIEQFAIKVLDDLYKKSKSCRVDDTSPSARPWTYLLLKRHRPIIPFALLETEVHRWAVEEVDAGGLGGEVDLQA